MCICDIFAVKKIQQTIGEISCVISMVHSIRGMFAVQYAWKYFWFSSSVVGCTMKVETALSCLPVSQQQTRALEILYDHEKHSTTVMYVVHKWSINQHKPFFFWPSPSSSLKHTSLLICLLKSVKSPWNLYPFYKWDKILK